MANTDNLPARYFFILKRKGYIDDNLNLDISAALRYTDGKTLEWVKKIAAQQSVQADAAAPSQTAALCPHCHQPILLVAPEPPRR